MALLTLAELRAAGIQGSDSALTTILAIEEAALVERFGPVYEPGLELEQEIVGARQSLFLHRRIASVVSITEASTLGGTATTLASTSYHILAKQGRVVRLPERHCWERHVVATYTPTDDTASWKLALIALIRLTLSETGLKSENIAGEYSYTAPDNWDAERSRVYRRLGFVGV